jgi:DNA replication protein DnaC
MASSCVFSHVILALEADAMDSKSGPSPAHEHYVVVSTGTGKTHLATALGVAACAQRKRVHFTTAAQLVTEMVEAQSQLQLARVRNRWMKYDLVVLDELGYVVMPDAAAELLFQVIAGRAEQAAIVVTTNL